MNIAINLFAVLVWFHCILLFRTHSATCGR